MKLSEYIRNEAPISEQLANQMFDSVHAACEKNGCDSVGTCHCSDDDCFRFTREFCSARGLADGDIIAWLESFGAYSDCALLLNVAIWYRPSGYDPEVDLDCNEINPDMRRSDDVPVLWPANPIVDPCCKKHRCLHGQRHLFEAER